MAPCLHWRFIPESIMETCLSYLKKGRKKKNWDFRERGGFGVKLARGGADINGVELQVYSRRERRRNNHYRGPTQMAIQRNFSADMQASVTTLSTPHPPALPRPLAPATDEWMDRRADIYIYGIAPRRIAPPPTLKNRERAEFSSSFSADNPCACAGAGS